MRRFLFNLWHRRTIKYLDACECGTAGNCVVCAGANEWLREREAAWGLR